MRAVTKRIGNPPTAVVAMGGHAFILPGQTGTPGEQSENAKAICRQVMTLVERDYNVVITHGNGPQVGDLLLRDELAKGELPRMPLDALVAQTEGSLGYFMQLALLNELRARAIPRYVVTVVTQVVVDKADPAFDSPTKPVGPFMEEDEARRREKELGWIIGADKARGFRRLVPSPIPLKILQRRMVREAAAQGHIVIAAGGGGIPVVKQADNAYAGIEAVIDKDLTSSVLATDVGAELLIILTAVDAVYLDFGTDRQRALGAVTLTEAEKFVADGHFPKGSMGPKVEAIVGFLRRGGRRGLITSADRLPNALDGEAGTHFVGRI